MPTLHIWKEDPIESEGQVKVGAVIEDESGARRALWYKLPARFSEKLNDSLNPFALGMLFTAMRESRDLVLHGHVSRTLLDNLEEFQIAWNLWRPELYKRISIRAEREIDDADCDRSKHALAAFSGGVDGSFTVYRHSKGLCGRLNKDLKAGLLIHGMDIPLEREDIFGMAAKKMGKMLESLDLELITIATNHRDLGDTFKDSHATAITSSMHLLDNYYSIGLVASSKPYNDLVLPWGSNPLTDRFMSSGRFEIVHDGTGHTRSEKIETISKWEEALKYLRVCWQIDNLDRNCCRCEKCIRTILSMRSLGIECPECFEHDVDDDTILNMRGLGEIALGFFEENLENARQRGITGSWLGALEKTIKMNRKSLTGWRRNLHELRNRHSVRTRLKEFLKKDQRNGGTE